MKRAKDYIIFPLDVATVKAAKTYVELLSESVGMFKVGLELFIRSGPELIDFINASAASGVFLDLKLHDIPATVFRAMEGIADLGVKYATVHCGETPRSSCSQSFWVLSLCSVEEVDEAEEAVK